MVVKTKFLEENEESFDAVSFDEVDDDFEAAEFDDLQSDLESRW